MERREQNRDFLKESHKLDKFSDQELAETIPGDAYVRISDVAMIMNRLSSRKEYRHAEQENDVFVQGLFKRLDQDIRNNAIPCRVLVEEEFQSEGRVPAAALLELVERMQLPDGGDQRAIKAKEDVFVADDPVFKEGDFRKKLTEQFPMRTPSTKGKIETREADHWLNIKRPMIMAIGLAAKYREQGRSIEKAEIPLYSETRNERAAFEQKRAEARRARTYRGNRY